MQEGKIVFLSKEDLKGNPPLDDISLLDFKVPVRVLYEADCVVFNYDNPSSCIVLKNRYGYASRNRFVGTNKKKNLTDVSEMLL